MTLNRLIGAALLGLILLIAPAELASASTPTAHRPRVTASCTGGHVTFSTRASGKLYVRRSGHLIARRHSHRVTVWSGGRRVTVYLKWVRHGRLVIRAHKSAVCPKPSPRKPAAARSVTTPAVCSDASFGAHRGGDAGVTGDSDLAFQRSYAAGARNEDTDIHFTSDDQPIILHGPSFDVFGHPEAMVSSTPLAATQGFVAADGARVWTLPQFVAWLVAHPAVTLATTELKTTPTGAEYQTVIADLEPVKSRVAVVSFTGSDLPPMSAAGFRTGLIYSAAIATSPSKNVPLSAIGQYGTLAQMDLHNLSASVVTELRAEGVPTIESWGNSGPAQYVRNPAGVVPLVDDVPGYLAWRKANC
jgi:Glycerophosphoryl diester phosphodiesterase family